MTGDPIANLVRKIHATEGPKMVACVAGGGSELFPILLARGGGSATLLSGLIPYDPAEFRAILGHDPGKLVDERAARGLAMAAFRRALAIRGDLPPDRVFGLGATSKLARGEGERDGRTHEIHAAIQSSCRTVVRSIRLPPGGDRAWEERINALALLNLVALGRGLGDSVPLGDAGRSVPDAAIEERSTEPDFAEGLGLHRLLEGLARRVAVDLAGGRFAPAPDEPPRLLLPGSFRPVHEGHLAMAGAASRLVGSACGFEISVTHPDKPPLDHLSIRSRLEGFEGREARVVLTDAPTFLDKARLFPGCTFAVGHDTAARIVDPRYYGGFEARDAVLAEMEALGTRFVVFGRVDDSGRFRDFDPTAFEQPACGFLGRIARPVPETEFRLDISSTEVRRRSGRDFA